MQKTIQYTVLALALIGAFVFYKKSYLELKDGNNHYQLIKGIDEKVIEKLIIGKELQIHYLAVRGTYAKQWDSLFNFLRHDSIYMTQDREIITHTPSGDKINIETDTIGIISAYDSLRNKIGRIPLSEIENLKYAPGHPEDSLVEFFINASVVKKAPVFEIYDPKPLNPKRLKPKERGGIPPLKIGSMQGPSIKGNWEY